MKILVIYFLVHQSLVLAYNTQFTVEDAASQSNDFNTISNETKGWVLNTQAKNFVKNVLKQMPCGFPELGVPSVAPYTHPDLELSIKNNITDLSLQFIRFKLEGLNDMIIKDLKVSYTFDKSVKFHFQFRMLKTTSAVLNLQILIDALQEMGVLLEYNGSNKPFEFTVENLSIKGSFKYKMSHITGPIRIYKFNAIFKLDKVIANIGSILGNKVLDSLLNKQIEKLIPDIINNNPKRISEELAKQIVPRMNAFLDGKKLWDILAISGKNCKPTPAPWLLRDQTTDI